MVVDEHDDISGAQSVERLSDGELIELVAGEALRSGVELNAHRVAELSEPELVEQGMTVSGARRVRAAFELVRRSSITRAPPPTLATPEEAYTCVQPLLGDVGHEHFVVLVLDVRNRPRRIVRVAKGSVDRCAVDPRDVFAPAIREHGSAIIVAHNHPSGDPTPSFEDIALTQRLMRAGELLGIPVLDHLIVASGPFVRSRRRFVSLAEMGVLGVEKRAVDDDVAVTGSRKAKPEILRLIKRKG